MNYTLQSSQTLSYWIKKKKCKVMKLFPTVTFNTFQTDPLPKRVHLKYQIQNSHRYMPEICCLIFLILGIQPIELQLLSKDTIKAQKNRIAWTLLSFSSLSVIFNVSKGENKKRRRSVWIIFKLFITHLFLNKKKKRQQFFSLHPHTIIFKISLN